MLRNCLFFSSAVIVLGAVLYGYLHQPPYNVYHVVGPPKVTLSPPAGTVKTILGGRLGETLVERHVTYANGDQGSAYFRSEDGSLRMTTEVYHSGTVKAKAIFNQKGNLIEGEVHRPDGSLFMYMQLLENGTQRQTFYDKDDRKLAFREQTAGERGYQDVYFSPDGVAVGRVDVIASENGGTTDNWIDVYPNGRTVLQKFRIQMMAPAPGTGQTGQLVSFYNHQDKVEYTQLWRRGTWVDGNPMGDLTIERVQELSYEGTVIRTLYFKEENAVVQLLVSKTTEQERDEQAASQGVDPESPEANHQGGVPATSRAVEVTKTYRIDEKERPEAVINSWEVQQPWNRSMPVVKMQRIFRSGTLMLEKRGEKETSHEASENIQEPSMRAAFLKGFVYKELSEARSNLQRQDTKFLGQPDKNDPCRWYVR